MLSEKHIVPLHVAWEYGSAGSVLLASSVSPSIAQNLLTEKQRSTQLSSHIKKRFRTDFESQASFIRGVGQVGGGVTNENLLPYLFISVSAVIDNWV